MKNTLRQIGIHAGVFCALLAILWLLLSLSALIPNEALHDNYRESADYYQEMDAFHFHDGELWNAISDNYADSILVDISWHLGDEGSPFANAIDTDYHKSQDVGKNNGLSYSVNENAETNTDYTRYWHGSAMFVRFFHLFTNVNGVKMIGFVMILLLAVLTVALLIKLKHPDLALLLALSLAAVQIWNVRLSLEYQPAFVIALALCPLYLIFERRDERYLTLFSVAGGVLIAFFDFLSTETMTILLPLILVIAVRTKEDRLPSWGKCLRLLFLCGLCWAIPYALTFLVKWGVASLVTGENAFVLAFASVAERVGSATQLGDLLGNITPTSFFSPIAANLTVLFGGITRVQGNLVIAGSVISLGILGLIWFIFMSKKPKRRGSLLILMLGILVLLRFLLLNNHSFLHEYFTYRALVSTILSLLVALRLNIALPKKKGARK